jgi:hypothetical protein
MSSRHRWNHAVTEGLLHRRGCRLKNACLQVLRIDVHRTILTTK